MRKIGLLALSVLFLTSCKFSGSWEVKETLTFKNKSKSYSIVSGKQRGDVSATKNKITLVFNNKPKTKIEVKIPKGKLTGKDGPFKILGSEIGQDYDFAGTIKTTSETTYGQCSNTCTDYTGSEVSCFPPSYYDCTTTSTESNLKLSIVDSTTQIEKATFNGSNYSSSTSADSDSDGIPNWNDDSVYP